MSWKANLKKMIPTPVLNRVLLSFPFLYRTRLVAYESNLIPLDGVEELRKHLGAVAHLDGAIIECGCSRCGGTVLMANYLKENGIQKTIYAYDSFEGFDLTELQREREAGWTTSPDTAFTSTSYEYVLEKIRKLGVDDTIKVVKGYFQDTLPQLEATICFALIDTDLKDSLVFCAETIWPHLVNGGLIIFDDYT
ncbi:MAG: TylF/MycF/NovP-related O-methyltransferase, partial [Candidatus Neomarinimicrobiota bacterium]